MTGILVAMNDFQAQWRRIREGTLAAVERVGESGWWILGDEVSSFERELAARWGLPHCVGCASGLDAIEIGLRCLGLEPGARVLTTPLTAFATALAIVRAGGVPVFGDVDASGQLDLEAAEELLQAHPDVRFLLPVHLYGHALPHDRLVKLRERYELRLLEDCAQAIGARSSGHGVGGAGQAAATSFYPTKNLGALGDAGALLLGDPSLAERARALRDYGQAGKYEHRHLGLNSRLDEIHAAILRDALLPLLDDFTERRRQVAERYRDGIRHPRLVLPPPPEGSESVWHLFPALVEGDREAFRAHLRTCGVASGIHYPKLVPDQEALRQCPGAHPLAPLPRARAFVQRQVSLPIHPFLDEDQVDRVIHACNGWTA